MGGSRRGPDDRIFVWKKQGNIALAWILGVVSIRSRCIIFERGRKTDSEAKVRGALPLEHPSRKLSFLHLRFNFYSIKKLPEVI
jgi:hypothetical protein